jgi:hypothetical protein
MKSLAIIIASIFLLSTAALAGDGTAIKKSTKKAVNSQKQVAEQFSNLLGYPSDILDGASETVMIAYSVDENNIMHVQEVSTSNAELKQYVLKHLDGKKMKNMQTEGKNGVVKVHFNGNKNQDLYFQH